MKIPRKFFFFSVLFIAIVIFFTARGFWHHGVALQKQVDVGLARQVVPTEIPKPKMAIILDDWGNNFGLVKAAVEIQRPLTLSILPNLAHSRRVPAPSAATPASAGYSN